MTASTARTALTARARDALLPEDSGADTSFRSMYEDDRSDALAFVPRPRRKIRPPGYIAGRSLSASCEGEVTFQSYADAMRATDGRRGNRDSKGRSPYHCDFCRKWHLGQGKVRQDQRYKRAKHFDESEVLK